MTDECIRQRLQYNIYGRGYKNAIYLTSALLQYFIKGEYKNATYLTSAYNVL